ncbi:MAG: beta-glucosidase BglX [Syntrophothermus sp.]
MKILIRNLAIFVTIALIPAITSGQVKTIEQRIDSVMSLMTIEEKAGQLNQYTGDWEVTGPITNSGNKVEDIKNGKLGSMLNIRSVKHTKALQEAAMQSRLKIPLIFGQDVIHGFRTTFPIPLAESASWDLTAIENGARIAATEAAAAGIHWTFAPMVDIARDPRWGRVMEGAGEDPYLGSLIAKARVKGFQGKGLGNIDAVMACVKHFAAYGAAIGGRDYNSVDMSMRTLHEVYLAPFKAAAEAGAATFMNSFNDLNGIPATGNSYIQRDVLKGMWNFQGFVVSDWGSIGEMIPHGFVKDNYEAAESAIKAGSDMDMESRSYINNLPKLVKDGKVKIEVVDDAVRRVLRKKFELGLFDDPFRFCNAEREEKTLMKPEFIEASRDMARKSIVMLKNEKQLLPLSKDLKTIAVIGPLAKSEKDMQGGWSVNWNKDDEFVSLFEGLQNAASGTKLIYAKGCEIKGDSKAGFDEAVAAAKQADVVIMAVGESFDMSGEAKSRSNIHIPGVQEDLIKAVYETGKPVVVLIMAGRPLVFNWTADNVPSILYTWFLGSQAGNAMADVLYGNYNPSAKLPMTFPRTEGQIPIYYNHYNTGRPSPDDDKYAIYRSNYLDLPKSPKFPFGFGLSYTTWKYDNLKLSSKNVKDGESVDITFTLTNSGKMAGEEIVQLYIRDRVAQPVRPVKELKDFAKVSLKPGESKEMHFKINKSKLQFYNDKLEVITQPGTFDVMIGASAADIRLQDSFDLQ